MDDVAEVQVATRESGDNAYLNKEKYITKLVLRRGGLPSHVPIALSWKGNFRCTSEL